MEQKQADMHDSNHSQPQDRSESGAPAAGRAVEDIFSTDEIFQRIVATADEETRRSKKLLFFSGFAAGLSISLSFVASASMSAATGHTILGDLLYPLGFVLVVLGRYQLFTENTLTPVSLALTRLITLPMLLAVWGLVLIANLLGAIVVAAVLAYTEVFSADTGAVALDMGLHVMSFSFMTSFWKAVFAGWIVASLVWLNHAVRGSTARLLTTFLLIFVVAQTDLLHCVAGASEGMYAVFLGEAGLGDFLQDFLLPTVLGNSFGGVLLVAMLNYSQTEDALYPQRDCYTTRMSWQEWLFGWRDVEPDRSARP